MTHRIACLRAVHVTALPYFTRLPVSCLSQQTREQARAVTEFSVHPAVFYHFRFSLVFGNFPNFWVQPSRPGLPARLNLSHPACASRLPISFNGAPGSVPRKVLNLPVVLRRSDTYSVTVQNTVDIPQMQLLDKLHLTTGAWS